VKEKKYQDNQQRQRGFLMIGIPDKDGKDQREKNRAKNDEPRDITNLINAVKNRAAQPLGQLPWAALVGERKHVLPRDLPVAGIATWFPIRGL
jgi:hypothetical protein